MKSEDKVVFDFDFLNFEFKLKTEFELVKNNRDLERDNFDPFSSVRSRSNQRFLFWVYPNK